MTSPGGFGWPTRHARAARPAIGRPIETFHPMIAAIARSRAVDGRDRYVADFECCGVRARSPGRSDYVITGARPGPTELLITYVCKAAFKLTQFDYAGALTVVMFSLFVFLALIVNLLAGGDAGKVDIAD